MKNQNHPKKKQVSERKLTKKRALITGITGQDGSYLAEFLVKKGYEVFGMLRRTSTDPLMRIEKLYVTRKVLLLNADLRDEAAIARVLAVAQPDEIYNLAAQSDVGISFTCPEETFDIDYHGVGRLVRAAMKQNKNVRIYQASTSEMYGKTKPPQSEISVFAPVSPYGEAKLKAHEDFVVGYRKKYGLFICSGILFNHESPRRGKHFVTRKITNSMVKVKLGIQKSFELGNLEAHRDWGFAGDYVEAMWKMLQQKKPKDYVIATGKSYTVREFFEAVAIELGLKITWQGKGLNEVAKDQHGKIIMRVNKKFYRPHEVDYLLGDSTLAQKELGWKIKTTMKQLVKMMVQSDMKLLKHLGK